MAESLNSLTADMLDYGNLFMYTTLNHTIYGIRTHCSTYDDVDGEVHIFYTNLRTGEFECVPVKELVEKLDSFMDFVVHFYKADAKEVDPYPIESIEDVMSFLGVDPSTLPRWGNVEKSKTEEE